jgi:rhomboid protease GluP
MTTIEASNAQEALHSRGMSSNAVEVYRSLRHADAQERAFVLTAVGIASELTREDLQYVLRVDSLDEAEARGHLLRYQEERLTPRIPWVSAPVRLHGAAWVGCVLYGVALLGIAYAVGAGVFRLDAFDLGDLSAADVRQGQWWRAWTALTLHLDAAHLAANLGAGVWFGYLAGRLLGPGVAWVLIVNGAAAANLLEGWFAPEGQRSAGASTAVFTALGLLAAYSWRERHRLPQSWPRRFSPLIAGVALLGWLGTAGEHTDVFAHLAGFAVGVLLGSLAAVPAVRTVLDRTPQWLAGALAIAAVALAWVAALS